MSFRFNGFCVKGFCLAEVVYNCVNLYKADTGERLKLPLIMFLGVSTGNHETQVYCPMAGDTGAEAWGNPWVLNRGPRTGDR